MANLKTNLATLTETLRIHRSAHKPCADRFARGHQQADALAQRLPLSHACSEPHLEKIWSDQALKSRRLLNAGNPPVNRDGSSPAEVILGTDDDVFLFVGPIRFQTSNGCGVLFSSDVERTFTQPMIATPFDSGGLVYHLAQKVPAPSPKDFLEAHELPVPDYRSYLSDFTASLFDPPPSYYLATDPPVCEEPIVITGGDVRRRTFEVRFRSSVSLGSHVLTVFLSTIVAQEPWAKAIITQCRRRGIAVRIFSTDDNLAYTHLVEATVAFITDLLEKDQP